MPRDVRDQSERLADDVDIRLLDLFEFFEDFEDELEREYIIRIARAAYGKGYHDAWTEIRPGSLYRDNGYGLPDRVQFTEAEVQQ